jgi:hypothetical protein
MPKMTRKGARQTVYVCCSITNDGELINKIIAAASPEEAGNLFLEQSTIKAKEILGPFYKKRTQVLENTRVLKFSNQTKKAIFNDWLVNAFLLKEPENQAYLVFIKRVDGKKASTPVGTITVPVSDLRFV